MSEVTLKKNRFVVIWACAVFSVLVLSMILLQKKKPSPHEDYFIDCTSDSILGYEGVQASVQLSVKLDRHSHGDIAFDGVIVTADNQHYRVSRVIELTYTIPTPEELVITRSSMEKSVTDTVSDQLFDTMLFDSKKMHIKLFLTSYRNGVFISNYFLPMIMCVGTAFSSSAVNGR